MHKVLLVDDQKLIRDGIKSLLGLSGKVAVVAECADGSTVVDACRQYQPEVILLDEPFSQIDAFRKNALRRNLFKYLFIGGLLIPIVVGELM